MSTIAGQIAATRPTASPQPTVAQKSASNDFASLLPETGADGEPIGNEVPIGTMGDNPAPTQAPPPGSMSGGTTGTIDTASGGTGNDVAQVGSGLDEIPIGLMGGGNDAAPAPGSNDSPGPGSIEIADGSAGSVGNVANAGSGSGTNEVPIGKMTIDASEAPAPGAFNGSAGDVYDQAGKLLAQIQALLTGTIDFAPINGVPVPGEWLGDSGAIAANNAYRKLQALPVGTMNSTAV